MKILAVHSATLPDAAKQSQVDHWRVYRPMVELAKHVDWQIDHQPAFLPDADKYKDAKNFTPEEFQKAYDHLSQYDIIFSSYQTNPSTFTLMMLLEQKAGVQYVMDVDDNMFAINPDNPFWLKVDHQHVFYMQRMIAHNRWITTPSRHLAAYFDERRPDFDRDTITVIPNYIADVYQPEAFDNSPDIVIGYMGGASHYYDLHDSGVLKAIEKLMHEHKNVRFKVVGQLVDHYIPKARLTLEEGARGDKFFTDVFPKLHMDIAVAPLLDNVFNKGKSNIKWQEMTRAGAAVIASNIGPYAALKDGVNAMLVNNTPEAWYTALKQLVERPKLRQILLDNARKDVTLNWKLENQENWIKYKLLFERIMREKHANANHRTESGLFAGQAK